MSKRILIDLRKANQSQKYQSEEELFQVEAFQNVSKILDEHNTGKETGNITNCRFHNTIFIDGDRGSGKTAFMLNLDKYYKDFAKDKKNNYEYLFLDPVDPTLLEHTEKFLSVILARVVEAVSCNPLIINDEEDKYFQSLEKLSQSLEAIKSIDNALGIEEIASSKSSLKLEQHAHDFFKIICELLGIHSLVMLIDDVDMAFDKGFDVLEVVRKYLSSPYIIPVVAGDMKLYKEIVETKFMDKIGYTNDVNNISRIDKLFRANPPLEIENHDHETLTQNREKFFEKKDLVENLVRQYINKVFPNEYHIKLKAVFRILRNYDISVQITDKITVPYTELKDFEIRHINLGINQVDFTYKIFSDNTRDLVQYLYAKKDIYKEFFKNYQNEKPVDYEKYIPQKVIKKYDLDILKLIFENRDDWYKKSLEITSDFYKYSNDGKKRELSSLVENDVNSYINDKYNIYKALTNDFFKTSKISPEQPNVKYAILRESYINLDKNHFDSKEKYIVDLFVYNNYYKNDATKNYIFSGKFLEMLIYSLSISSEKMEDKKLKDLEIQEKNLYESLKSANNIYKTDIFDDCLKGFNAEKLDDVMNMLSEIKDHIPFNSEFLYNKNFEKKESKELDDEEIENSIINYKVEDLKDLTKEIVIWKSLFVNNVKLNSISLYEVTHKFFNNLNVLKDEVYSDRPIAFMQRIVLIFINSIAYFENTEKKVSHTNMAVSNSKKKDFSVSRTLTYTAASFLNIKPMLNVEGSLTRALFFHPIISYILFTNESNRLYKDLWFEGQKKVDKDVKLELNETSADGILRNYGFASGIGQEKRLKVIKKLIENFDNFDDNIITEIKESKGFKNIIQKNYSDKEYLEQLSKLKFLFDI